MIKKRLGQNFLYDPSILNKLIEGADLSPDDSVIEIGPGPGRLTRMLSENVKRVTAIELDRRFYEQLKGDLAGRDNIELIHGDALKFPYENMTGYKVVANIPYYITSPIIFRLLKARGQIISITLTLQKEVAARIVAGPGGKDYGVLSIMVQYHAEPELKFIIPREAFRPVPRVDSAVIHMRTLKKPPVSVQNEEFFFRVVKTSFSQRRKMLANSLKGFGKDIKDRLILCDIDPRKRPETVSIEEFALLSNALFRKE